MVSVGKSAFLAGLFALSSAGLANAQPQIIGPGDPGGGGGSGGGGDCYRIAETIDGPYTVSFCLGNANRYEVTGDGLSCEGRLRWSRSGSARLEINLRRASCGGGKAWSADSLSCSYGNIGAPSTLGGGGGGPQSVTPNNPDFGNVLRCTYDPSVPGHPSSQVTAHRVG
ncbi:MAG: hypothetical protein IT535_11515 [Bauldia sp.]|nr:hypothetical protein [Bauldia sp.]